MRLVSPLSEVSTALEEFRTSVRDRAGSPGVAALEQALSESVGGVHSQFNARKAEDLHRLARGLRERWARIRRTEHRDESVLFEVAMVAYERLIAINAGDHSAHAGRGDMLRSLGRLDEARHAFDQALAIEPATVSYVLALAHLYSESGELDETIELLHHAADLALAQDKIEVAREALHSVLKLRPEDPSAKQKLRSLRRPV